MPRTTKSSNTSRAAARTLRLKNNVQSNGQLFLAGYSEGGYVTMAAHRALQAGSTPHRDELRPPLCLAVAPLANQGEWLLKLGIGQRAKALAKSNPAEAANIARAIERLTSPEQMGTLFKVLCAHSPGLRPAGF